MLHTIDKALSPRYVSVVCQQGVIQTFVWDDNGKGSTHFSTFEQSENFRFNKIEETEKVQKKANAVKKEPYMFYISLRYVCTTNPKYVIYY